MTVRAEHSGGWFVRVGERILRTRWLVRAPIAVFRAGAGFLFGGRLLLLEHTGRTSGLTRYVVLEVIARPARGSFVVPSGFGRRSQWYRNVVAHPLVRVRWSSRPSVAAIAHPLSQSESAAILAEYAVVHPRAWAQFSPVFEATLGAPLDGPGTELPLVRLDAVPKKSQAGRAV